MLSQIDALPECQGKLGKRALVWLIYARDGLSVTDLQQALAIDPDTFNINPDSIVLEEQLVACCCNVITIGDDQKFCLTGKSIMFSVPVF